MLIFRCRFRDENVVVVAMSPPFNLLGSRSETRIEIMGKKLQIQRSKSFQGPVVHQNGTSCRCCTDLCHVLSVGNFKLFI